MPKKKIEIKVSKMLIRLAIEDAATGAARAELAKQVREQIKGTYLEGSGIFVTKFEQYVDKITLHKIPDTADLTFTWVD